MAMENRLRTELFKALKGSVSIASAKTVLDKLDSLHDFTVIYVDKNGERKLRADDLLRRVRKRRNDFVTSVWPEALTFLKDVRDFSQSDLPRAIDAISRKLREPESVPSDWDGRLRNLVRDVDAITDKAEALHGTLVDLEVKVRAAKDELHGLVTNGESDPVVAVEKEQIRKATAIVAGAGAVAVVATGMQWKTGSNEPENSIQCWRAGISCFGVARSIVEQGLDDADELIDPAIPHRSIIIDDAEVCLAEMTSQLQALINSSVAAHWRAVKDAIEMLRVQLRDGNGYRESALAELQEVKHLCNVEATPDTS